VEVARLIKLFFGLCVLHSLTVVGPFLARGGTARSFGLGSVTYDELAMIALPIGIALLIWSRRGRALFYLIGVVLVFLSLVGTQSRAPIAFGVLGSFLALWISYRRLKRIRSERDTSETDMKLTARYRVAGQRVAFMLGMVVLLIVMVLTLQHGLFEGVLGRFEQLLTHRPEGSFLVRITLWKTAIGTFLDHPLLGVGPGLFTRLRDVYETIHLDPIYLWARGKSAHNLLLHYLAETGLVGGTALMALFVNQFRLARRNWLRTIEAQLLGPTLALYLCGFLFMVTTFFEAGWMWSQTGLIAAFFIALIARQSDQSSKEKSHGIAAE